MCCRYFHSALFFLSLRLPTTKMRRRILRARGDFCEKVSNFIFWISLLPTFLLRHSPYLKPPVCAQICDCKFVLTKIKRNFPKMSSSPRNISLLDLVCKESLPAILVQLKLRIFFSILDMCIYTQYSYTECWKDVWVRL